MSESDEERPSCSCSKTKCVQRRCMCFKARYYCSDYCKCLGCLNTECNEAYVEEQVELILKKKKVAVVEEATQMPSFAQEAKQVFAQSSGATLGDERLSRVKGCSCREIKCSNMNCECFKFMARCTEKCQCEGCANSFGIKGSDFIIKPEIHVKKIIKLEQNDTGGITSEAIKMENRTQSEEASSSDPNKRPRILPSEHDTTPP
ncbi:CRC domain-containing protein TSO1-like isoform X2 [Phragmites australis]|uniref:CRC domain-containing protein TSO1-like isoform X2 n=1 Tax=Phragmites australis TaxID=29695 RepID=UPI002D7803A3|nr:CRC domain-containing protein TSO1-like isoform X2 [Phragmites australis]